MVQFHTHYRAGECRPNANSKGVGGVFHAGRVSPCKSMQAAWLATQCPETCTGLNARSTQCETGLFDAAGSPLFVASHSRTINAPATRKHTPPQQIHTQQKPTDHSVRRTVLILSNVITWGRSVTNESCASRCILNFRFARVTWFRIL